jgi:hypothetical protein
MIPREPACFGETSAELPVDLGNGGSAVLTFTSLSPAFAARSSVVQQASGDLVKTWADWAYDIGEAIKMQDNNEQIALICFLGIDVARQLNPRETPRSTIGRSKAGEYAGRDNERVKL